MRGLQDLSIWILVTGVASAGVVGIDISLTAYDIKGDLGNIRDKYERATKVLVKSVQLDVAEMRLSDAVRELEDAREEDDVSFYSITVDGEEVASGGATNVIPSLARDKRSDNQFQEVKLLNIRYGFFRRNTSQRSEILIGAPSLSDEYLFWRIFADERMRLIRDAFWTILVVGVLVYHRLRDIVQLANEIKTRGKPLVMRGRSEEGQILARAVQGAVDENQGLRESLSNVENQISSGPLSEIKSGSSWPKTFECTVVRTDLNGFTKLHKSVLHDHMLSRLNEFKLELQPIVTRYGGHLYENAGDESIYYFKEGEYGSSSRAAICAIDEINALASRVSERTLAEKGYLFCVKSSVSRGFWTYYVSDGKLVVDAEPLIESVRILDLVSDKQTNQVIFSRSVADAIKPVAESSLVGNREVDNYGHMDLFRLEALRPLANHLSDGGDWRLAKHYRTNTAASRMLKYLSENIAELAEDKVIGLTSFVKSVSWEESAVSVKDAFFEFFKSVMQHENARMSDGFLNPPRTRRDVFLSATIMLTKQIKFSSGLPPEIEELLMQASTSGDHRVVADAVEVFRQFDPSDKKGVLARLRHHPNNRVRANVLIAEGSRKFGQPEHDVIVKMLAFGVEREVASALYALSEIARVHAERNYIEYCANLPLQRALENARRLSANSSHMIREQQQKLAETEAKFKGKKGVA